MTQPTKEELLTEIEELKNRACRLEQMVRKVIPDKQWYTTTEAASKKGLATKTISNYVGRGKYKRTRKNDSGNWEIHKSELDL